MARENGSQFGRKANGWHRKSGPDVLPGGKPPVFSTGKEKATNLLPVAQENQLLNYYRTEALLAFEQIFEPLRIKAPPKLTPPASEPDTFSSSNVQFSSVGPNGSPDDFSDIFRYFGVPIAQDRKLIDSSTNRAPRLPLDTRKALAALGLATVSFVACGAPKTNGQTPTQEVTPLPGITTEYYPTASSTVTALPIKSTETTTPEPVKVAPGSIRNLYQATPQEIQAVIDNYNRGMGIGGGGLITSTENTPGKGKMIDFLVIHNNDGSVNVDRTTLQITSTLQIANENDKVFPDPYSNIMDSMTLTHTKQVLSTVPEGWQLSELGVWRRVDTTKVGDTVQNSAFDYVLGNLLNKRGEKVTALVVDLVLDGKRIPTWAVSETDDNGKSVVKVLDPNTKTLKNVAEFFPGIAIEPTVFVTSSNTLSGTVVPVTIVPPSATPTQVLSDVIAVTPTARLTLTPSPSPESTVIAASTVTASATASTTSILAPNAKPTSWMDRIPNPTETSIPTDESVENLPITPLIVDNFRTVMIKAGLPVSTTAEIIKDFKTNTITGTDGIQYQVKSTKDGGYPLMIKAEGGKWRSQVVTYLLESEGIKFGFPWENINNFWSKNRTRPTDALVSENSTISFPAGAFRWDIIFNNKAGKEMTTHVANGAWSDADAYINFTKENNINPGSPFIFGRSNGIDVKMSAADISQNVSTIVTKYSKDIHSWTFNELFDEQGALTFSRDKVNAALKAVRASDPSAQVVINTGAIETDPLTNKRYLEFITSLMTEGLIREGDIIGVQGHVGSLFNKTSKEMETALENFIKLGLKIRFTELDVMHVGTQNRHDEERKAYVYLQYFNAARDLNKKYNRNVVDAIIVYGTTNDTSWLRDDPINADSKFPALLNEDGSPELAYYLIAQNLAQGN